MAQEEEASASRKRTRVILFGDSDDEDFVPSSGWTWSKATRILGSDSVHDPEESSHEQPSTMVATPVGMCDLRCQLHGVRRRLPNDEASNLPFQCELGPVVCATCRDKLDANGNGKCHVCGVATRFYRRCHAAVDRLLEYDRLPNYSTPPYHGMESHRQVCPHAPMHCPGKSCSFIGCTSALLDHFAGAHNWPCYTKVKAGKKFTIRLRDGFNFFLLEGDQSAANCSARVPCRLFLMNMMKERLGRAISVICIHPHASAATANNSAHQVLSTQCELVFSCKAEGSLLCHSHKQSSVFKVVCTDLSSGLPNPEGCFQFFVHNAILGDGDNMNSIQVKARIIN